MLITYKIQDISQRELLLRPAQVLLLSLFLWVCHSASSLILSAVLRREAGRGMPGNQRLLLPFLTHSCTNSNKLDGCAST